MAGAPRAIGSSADRYVIQRILASGGMATVYLARFVATSGFGRAVALKRMHPELASDPECVAMFVEEARLAARIRHSNVASILDVAACGTELLLVMDFVEGPSLAQLFGECNARGAAVPAPIGSRIMLEVLHGLHAAHEAKDAQGAPLGIVHRDVSPANVLVGNDGVTRLIDFGVAKAKGRLWVTREGTLKGKLRYMAPEQILAGAVSRRSDVYAASVVLWETLTGRPLFQGNTQDEVLEQVLLGQADRVSRFVPGADGRLDALLVRGMHHDPARRFETAREMAAALERCIPPASGSEVADWLEKNHPPLRTEARATDAWTAAETTVELTTFLDHHDKERSPAPTPLRRRGTVLSFAFASCAVLALVAISSNFHPRAGANLSHARTPPAEPPSAPDPAVDDSAAMSPPVATPPALRNRSRSSSPGRRESTPRTKAKSDCTVPYTFNSAAEKVYKRECL